MAIHIKKYLSPIIVGIIVVIFGLIVSNHFGFYDRIVGLDKVYHILGGTVLGWFFYRYFTGAEFKLTPLNLILVSVAAVCLIGVFWEFAERLASIYSPEYFPWLFRYFHGGDLNDTLLDLVSDMSGGLMFVAVSVFTSQK